MDTWIVLCAFFMEPTKNAQKTTYVFTTLSNISWKLEDHRVRHRESLFRAREDDCSARVEG
jgi:hypothetical protein